MFKRLAKKVRLFHDYDKYEEYITLNKKDSSIEAINGIVYDGRIVTFDNGDIKDAYYELIVNDVEKNMHPEMLNKLLKKYDINDSYAQLVQNPKNKIGMAIVYGYNPGKVFIDPIQCINSNVNEVVRIIKRVYPIFTDFFKYDIEKWYNSDDVDYIDYDSM